MDERHLQMLRRLHADFELYAPQHLFIVDKLSRQRKPFHFNDAQRLLHVAVESQRIKRRMVRVIICKGRQQGISTYVTGRGYWRTSLNKNTNAFVMTHEMKATANLFSMIRDYHKLCPAAMRPTASADAASEMKFGRLGSSYAVATARSKGAGRSFNVQFLHGSEAAFWPNISDNLAALGQALSESPGSESYLETTGNGHNEFHALVKRSLAGQSDYEVVFIPWFLQSEYRRKPGKDLELTEAEWEYADTYGLDLEQMAWMVNKIATDFGGDSTIFDQEYPASIERAFRRSSTTDPFIRLATTEAARKRKAAPSGPTRLGIDPSQGSKKSDRFAFVERDDTGIRWKHRLKLNTDDTMEAANACARIINERQPDVVFIDRLGMGAGICDKLSEIMPNHRIVGVKASEAAANTERYANKRAEMWGEMREWLINGAEMLDDDELEADLNGPGFKYRNEAYVLESKESMEKRGLPSPDFGDGIAHTFYLPYSIAARQSRDELRSGAGANWKTA